MCQFCENVGEVTKKSETGRKYVIAFEDGLPGYLYALLPTGIAPTSLPSCLTIFTGYIPLIARIQLKVLTLIYRSHIGQAPRYLRDLIRLPSSVISLRPLRSLDRHDLCVEDFYGSDTSLCHHWPFALDQLLPSTRSTLLIGEPSASFRSLKTALFSLGLSHWKRF